MKKNLFSEKLQKKLHGEQWLIAQNDYNPKENLKYETLFALSNGYIGIRGAYEEGTEVSLPYLFMNGIFDKSETFMRELCALPNWLGLRLYVEKEQLGVETCEILEFCRVLDMRGSFLARRTLLRDSRGRETLLEGIRYVSRNNVHRMGIRLYVTPINYSGILEIESITDGTVINFLDAPRFKVKHTYQVNNTKLGEEGAYIEVATRDRHLHVGCGSVLEAEAEGKDVLGNRTFHTFGEKAVEFGDVRVKQGVCVEITKYVSMYSERECEACVIRKAVEGELKKYRRDGFEKEMEATEHVYSGMWENADIRMEGDRELDKAVRFNIFHLMSTGNERDSHVNVGAKLLTGEEYGGHAFWDTELFMLPFFSFIFPDTARNLVTYRYHMLGAAKENAKKNGYQGAQYPWESADDGTEQCPDWTIEPDGTCYRCYVADYEHHVTAAVAYGVYNYVKITKDYDFLYCKGLEILIETARFWTSRCEYVEEKNRYEINRVTGPDEWHEPIDNNVYTNYLARWNLKYVIKLLEREKPMGNVSVKQEEVEKWKRIADLIYLPKKEDSNLLEQFEGYFELEDVTIEEYDENDWPIRPERLKTKKAIETRIIKQADIVMLLHLLGEEFTKKEIEENYHYYEKRTLHGSSLSPSIYSIMGLKVGDGSKAYRYLRRAALLDLLNLQKNTREGIHAANAGGVWQTVVFGFAGISIDERGILCVSPKLPKEWSSLMFRLHYQNAWLEFVFEQRKEPVIHVLNHKKILVSIEGVLHEL